jgi:hypothetical protein
VRFARPLSTKSDIEKEAVVFLCSSNPLVAFLFHFLHMRVTSISSP